RSGGGSGVEVEIPRVEIGRLALVERETLEDVSGRISRGDVIEIQVAGEFEEPFPLDPVEPAQHHLVDLPLLPQAEDDVPLDPGPFLLVVVLTEHDHHEVGLLAVEVRQVLGQVRARELGAMVLVVQNLLLTESAGEDVRDGRDVVPLLSGIGDRDPETLAHGDLTLLGGSINGLLGSQSQPEKDSGDRVVCRRTGWWLVAGLRATGPTFRSAYLVAGR